MSTTHACPGECGQQVRRTALTCRADWLRLPLALRRAVRLTYREGTALEHRIAVLDALEWFRRNRPAS